MRSDLGLATAGACLLAASYPRRVLRYRSPPKAASHSSVAGLRRRSPPCVLDCPSQRPRRCGIRVPTHLQAAVGQGIDGIARKDIVAVPEDPARLGERDRVWLVVPLEADRRLGGVGLPMRRTRPDSRCSRLGRVVACWLQVAQAGSRGSRPTNVRAGQLYHDTMLGYVIIWDGRGARRSTARSLTMESAGKCGIGSRKAGFDRSRSIANASKGRGAGPQVSRREWPESAGDRAFGVIR
jgi:hypothetical protein